MEGIVQELFSKYPVGFTILAGLVAAHALALFVVNLTPTPADDNIVKKVYKVVEWVAGVVSDASKDKGDDDVS